MARVFLGIGSNLGDRIRYISEAVREIKNLGKVEQVSSLYETEPVGMEPTSSFYNVVLEIETPLLPPVLLSHLQAIETKIGRKPETHNKPREIDIDIELYDAYIYRDETIETPHPELHKRKFVLEPFNEIAPRLFHPVFRKTIEDLTTECSDTHTVVRTDYLLTT